MTTPITIQPERLSRKALNFSEGVSLINTLSLASLQA